MTDIYLSGDREDINKAFRVAMGDITGNVALYQGQTRKKPEPVILAGMGYDRPWTRDAAINVWNGWGLIDREISRNTLNAMVTEDRWGKRIGGQYWDAVIWVTGAWHYYLYSGDREYLKEALEISLTSLRFFEETEHDPETGLFRGAPCYADGISAYPDRYTAVGPYHDIQYWAEHNPEQRQEKGEGLPIEALSTNCLYCNAYKLLPAMASELDLESDPRWDEMAEKIKTAINKFLWIEDKGLYRYFIDPWGGCDAQDGLGHSLAILLGIADRRKRDRILANQHVSPAGIPCLWPVFDRYLGREDHVGRHNGTVWPHIQGFWGSAAALEGNREAFVKELEALTRFALRDGQFGEVFHPETGVEYGGLQENSLGEIEEYFFCHRQTWSATAYLRLLFTGVFGMRFSEEGIDFIPLLPESCSRIYLQGLKYRNMNLNIAIEGSGTRIQSFSINGKNTDKPFLPSSLEGDVRVDIVLN